MVLFTALIGPYFVDWTSYRETFEREASAYVGRPVTVDGKASVRLLPTPVLSFTDIHVGDRESPDVEMERFRAEVELAPLLKGEVRIIQMAVERPRFHIDIGGLSQNRGVFGEEWRLDPDRISLERLQIIEGAATVDDSATGRSWTVDGIDAVIEATTLRGPARVDADLSINGEPVAVRASLGRYTNLSTIAMNLWISSPRLPVTISTDGTLHLSEATPPSYDGTATVEGVPPADGGSPSRWADFRASGAFELEPADLTVTEMQLSYGATERPLIVEATGQVNFGERPEFDLALSARQIDLDRTLGGGEGDPFAIEGALASLVELLPRAAPPPIPGVLRLDAQGVVVGGSVVQAVRIDLVTAGNSWVVDSLAAMLPGETRIDLDGTLGLSADTTFRGHARMTSERPAAFAAWWRGTAGSAGRIGSFAVEADLDLTPDNQQLSSLAVTTPGGTIEGSVEVRRFAQSGHRFVNIGLSAERADLVETRALSELLVGKAAGAGIGETTLSFTATAGALSAGGVDARSVQVEGGLENGQFNFRRLSVADLAGASIDAHGSIQDPFGTPSGRIDGTVKADDIGGAAKFLSTLLPESVLARRLEEAAPILSPVAAEIFAEAGAAGERVSLDLSGSFADTHLFLEARGAGSLAAPESFVGTLKLNADGQDSAKVLRQLGFDLLPVQSAPFRVNADFNGALASGGKLKLTGTAAGVDLTYDAQTTLSDEGIATAGDFTAVSGNIDTALLLAGVAVPGLGEGHSASASGRMEYAGEKLILALNEGTFDEQAIGGSLAADLAKGVSLSGELKLEEASLPALAALVVGTVPKVEQFRWSDAAFTEGLPKTLALDFALDVARLDLGAPIGASNAALDFALADGKLDIGLNESEFAGGTLKGTLGAAMSGGQADVSIRAGLTGAALQSVVWDRLGLPTASGTLDVSFEAVGRGRSMAGILATLSGSGSFSIDGGRLNALNADALTAVMAMAEGDTDVDPDENAARETFATLFGSGAMPFGRATGSFSIANGAVSIPTVSLAAGKTKVLADAAMDLNTLTLQSKWTVRIEEGAEEAAQPYVPVVFRGPIVRPTREVDLNPLLNLLRSRFLQRQLEELEELKRLQEESERRAAEEAARQAEEEARRAAEEAAQQAAEDAALTTGATGSDAETEAPADTGASASPGAPVELVPAPPAEPAPAPPPPAPRAQVQPAPPPPPPPPVEERPVYRTLPNGVTVKVR